jgi:YD repeat-containing protein
MNTSLLRLMARYCCAVALVVGLFLAPRLSFAAACDVASGPAPDPQHLLVRAACATSADAQQACESAAAQYLPAYSPSTVCQDHTGLPESWGGGNWCTVNAGPGSCPSGQWVYLAFWILEYYTSTQVDIRTLCGPSNICVSDPINPASGAVYKTEADLSHPDAAIAFSRYYNSTDSSGIDLSTGWRHSFSRSLKPRSVYVIYQPYQSGNPNYSSAYADASTACTSGFAQIKARVGTWQNATASYANGVCMLTQGGVIIGTLPLFAFQPQTASAQVFPIVNAIAGPTIIGVDVTRDDGQLITFWIQAGAIVAPPSINLKLQQTGSGYTLIDANDTVETYDANGKLLTITSRAGVVQTMSYDASGRLSSVSDTFGHQLTLSYDNQNRLSTVTRQ